MHSAGLGHGPCVADDVLQDEGYELCVADDLLQDDRNNMLRQKLLTLGGEHLGECWGNLGAIFR